MRYVKCKIVEYPQIVVRRLITVLPSATSADSHIRSSAFYPWPPKRRRKGDIQFIGDIPVISTISVRLNSLPDSADTAGQRPCASSVYPCQTITLTKRNNIRHLTCCQPADDRCFDDVICADTTEVCRQLLASTQGPDSDASTGAPPGHMASAWVG